MKIEIPDLNKQKKIAKEEGISLKKNKVRTSFEISENLLDKFEKESEKLEVPPSELLRRIVEDTDIDVSEHKKRVKNVTLYSGHMEKLERIAKDLVPDPRKGRSNGNKNTVVEILIDQYFKDLYK